MKKRKGVTILAVFAALFLVAAVAVYLIGQFALQVGPNFNQLFEGVINSVTKFDDLLVTIPVFAVAGVWFILSLIWIIVDAKRKNGVVALFVILFLLAAGVLAAYYPYFYNSSAKFTKFVALELVTAALAVVSYLLFVILFIADLVTGGKKEQPVLAPAFEEKAEAEPVYEEIKDEDEVKEEKAEEAPAEEEVEEEVEEELEEEEFEEEEEEAVEEMAEEPKEKKAAKKKTAAKKTSAKEKAPAKEKTSTRATQTVLLTNEDGQVYAKAYHVSRRPELNKWQVKATGSKKVLKLFNTQKEAIEYAESLSKSTGASVRVHSKAGKIRKHK